MFRPPAPSSWQARSADERSDIRDSRGHCSRMSLRSSGLRSSSGNPTPSRHEGGRKEREHDLAALVGAGIAGLQDAPFGALIRSPLGFDLVGKADGVAGQNRLDQEQLTKARR